MDSFKAYYELVKEETLLSSDGETQDFAKMQSQFNMMLGEDAINYNPIDEKVDVWCFEILHEKEDAKKKLFDKVDKIEEIPVYRHMLMFLLLNHKLAIGEDNMKGLWNYLEKNSKKLKIKTVYSVGEETAFREKLKRDIDQSPCEFDNKMYDMLLAILANNVKEAYVKNGYGGDFTSEKFVRLILKPSEGDIHNLALAYQMDYTFLRVFRKKILKKSGINFFDRNQILLSFVIKYSRSCGEYKYFEALKKLEEKYPKTKAEKKKLTEEEKQKEKEEKKRKKKELKEKNEKEVNNKANTTVIRNELTKYLEKEGSLKEEFRKDFFNVEVVDTYIATVLKTIDMLEKSKKERTAEVLFNKYWEKFEKRLTDSNEAAVLFELQGKEDAEDRYFGKLNTYRWLYGDNVINGAEDLPDDKMRLLGSGREDFFLDSKVFLETRIRNNTFHNFPVNEERQRNLLLTVLFLNFAFEEYNLGDFEDRIEDFDIYVTDKLAKAGFQLMYSGNPYDVFLKVLLSCDMPLELFRYIWKLKTNSEE